MNSDFIEACKEGNIKQANNLVKAGIDPNQVDKSGRTPLRWAAQICYLEITKLLLKAGANPNQTDIWKNVPLHWAALDDFLEIVKLLLKAGADPNQANNDGETPLRFAALKNNLEMVELLKSYENKISSLSLLCLRTIYQNQINMDNIPNMILEWSFHQ